MAIPRLSAFDPIHVAISQKSGSTVAVAHTAPACNTDPTHPHAHMIHVAISQSTARASGSTVAVAHTAPACNAEALVHIHDNSKFDEVQVTLCSAMAVKSTTPVGTTPAADPPAPPP